MSIEINMIDVGVLGIKNFIKLVCDSYKCIKEGLHMHTISLTLNGIKYKCIIFIVKDQVMFENGFLILHEDGSGSLKTRNVDLDESTSKRSKLDTIFYL